MGKSLRRVLISAYLFVFVFANPAYAFLYLPFNKSYSPKVYFYDDYTLSQGWTTYGPKTGSRSTHKGTDYRGDGYGTPVYAAFGGTVVERTDGMNDQCDITEDDQVGFGNYIRIDHGNGYRTVYAHMKQNSVKVSLNAQVKKGDLVGYISNSGNTNGTDCQDLEKLPKGSFYHLHFQVEKWDPNEKKWDPQNPYNPDTWLWATNPPEPVISSGGGGGGGGGGGPSSCIYQVGEWSSRQALFQQAYDRVGGRNVMGCPLNRAYWWSGMVRQDFPGVGGFGAAAILHDEPADNPAFSIPAYVVHGGIWAWYKNNPVYGPPASDEYLNAFGAAQSDFRDGFIYWTGAVNPRRYILKGSGPEVYYIEGGRKRHIQNQDTLFALGYNWGHLQQVSDAQLAVFPTGEPIPNVFDIWLAEYFDNMVWRFPPKITRAEANLDFDWGFGSPHPLVPNDKFSGRFSRYLNFPPGESRFEINVDDGYTLYIDGHPVQAAGLGVSNYAVTTPGWHLVQILYQEYTGPAYFAFQDVSGPLLRQGFGGQSLPLLGNDGWFRGSVTVSISAQDVSGVAEIAYRVDRGDLGVQGDWVFVPGPGPVEVVFDIDGVYSLHFNAKDTRGNWGIEQPLIIPIDQTNPETNLSLGGPLYEGPDGKVFVSSSTELGLEATDNLSGVAEIQYGANEEPPQTYAEPFGLAGPDGLYQINYQSEDVAGNVEPENQAEFYLDNTPPGTTDDSDGIWRNADVTVNLASSDGEGSGVSGIYYQGSQEGVAVGSQAELTFTEEGTHPLSYHGVDNLGNTEGEKATLPVRIDKTPPQITGAPDRDPNPQGWYKADVTIHFEASDQEHLSGLAEVSPDVVISEEGRGQEVLGTAWDVAGNVAQTLVGGINLDKTAPESHLLPLNPYYSNHPLDENPLQVGFEALDPLLTSGQEGSGVRRVRLYKRLAGYQSAPGEWDYHSYRSDDKLGQPFNIRTLMEGRWEFASRALDLAGNLEDLPQDADAFTLYDITPPVSEITSLAEGKYYNAQSFPGIFGTSADPLLSSGQEGSGVERIEVEVMVDTPHSAEASRGNKWILEIWDQNWSLVDFVPADGFYTVRSRASDRAGNTESTFEVSFVYDATPPSTSYQLEGEEGENGWYVSPPSLALAASDATSGVSQIFYRVDQGDPEVYKEPLSFSDGVYNIEFWSVDLAENSSERQTILFKVDTTPPAAPVASVAGGSFAEGSSFGVELLGDRGDSLFYALNGGDFILYTGPISIGDDATLSFYAQDEAGNKSEVVGQTYAFFEARIEQILGAESDTDLTDNFPGDTLGLGQGSQGVSGEDQGGRGDRGGSSGSFPGLVALLLVLSFSGGILYVVIRRLLLR